MEVATFFNGQKMPYVGLGLWQINDAVKFENGVNTALELGYRHFDIAYTYKNESELGTVLQKWLTAGKIKREDLFITTKLPQIGMDKTRVEHFLKLSLAALRLEYVDLYLIHFPVGFKYLNDQDVAPVGDDGNALIDDATDINEIWKVMEKQVEDGRTKAIGLSNFNATQIQRLNQSVKIHPACLQIEMNVYLQQPELLDICKSLNIVVVGYGNLGSPGRIKYFKEIGRSETDFVCPKVLTDAEVVKIAEKHTKTSSQILLRFLIQNGVVCIPSTTNAEWQKQNIQVFDFKLDEDDMKALKALDQGESGRSFKMAYFKGAVNHPEYPFPKVDQVKPQVESIKTLI